MKLNIFTEAQVVELLVDRAAKSTAAAVAGELGISPQYLNDITKGRKRPSDLLLSRLDLERVIREKEMANGKKRKG